MVKITEALIRKRAEHNEGQLSNLEEVSLHQQDIERIEYLDKWCRELRILYLQSNLISKIENVGRLKKLEYLNLALNNVERIENVEACESLKKLDLTVNFISELSSIQCLTGLEFFQELFLTGNPCTEYEYYREYVIATLPRLKYLDGLEIARSDRIKAAQVYEEAKRRVSEQETAAYRKRLKEKEAEQKRLERKETENKLGFDGRWYTDINESDKAEPKSADPNDEDLGDRDQFNSEDKKFWAETVPFTPESRREVHDHMKKQRERGQNEDDDKNVKRERRLVSDDGRVLNVNEGKLDFTLTDDEERNMLILSLETYKYLDMSLLDVDVQPTHVRALVKGKVFQLVLPEPVNADSAAAKRSQTTGHLLIEMPKAKQVIKNTKPTPKLTQKTENNAQVSSGPRREKLEVDASGRIDLNIVKEMPLSKGPLDPHPPASRPERPNSAGFVDDPDVPPLV